MIIFRTFSRCLVLRSTEFFATEFALYTAVGVFSWLSRHAKWYPILNIWVWAISFGGWCFCLSSSSFTWQANDGKAKNSLSSRFSMCTLLLFGGQEQPLRLQEIWWYSRVGSVLRDRNFFIKYFYIKIFKQPCLLVLFARSWHGIFRLVLTMAATSAEHSGSLLSFWDSYVVVSAWRPRGRAEAAKPPPPHSFFIDTARRDLDTHCVINSLFFK